MTNKAKIEYNKKSLDKDIYVVSADGHGKIVDVIDEETFLVLMDKTREVKEVDIFDIRYV